LGRTIRAVKRLVEEFFWSSLDIKKYFFRIVILGYHYNILFITQQTWRESSKNSSGISFSCYSAWRHCGYAIFHRTPFSNFLILNFIYSKYKTRLCEFCLIGSRDKFCRIFFVKPSFPFFTRNISLVNTADSVSPQ